MEDSVISTITAPPVSETQDTSAMDAQVASWRAENANLGFSEDTLNFLDELNRKNYTPPKPEEPVETPQPEKAPVAEAFKSMDNLVRATGREIIDRVAFVDLAGKRIDAAKVRLESLRKPSGPIAGTVEAHTRTVNALLERHKTDGVRIPGTVEAHNRTSADLIQKYASGPLPKREPSSTPVAGTAEAQKSVVDNLLKKAVIPNEPKKKRGGILGFLKGLFGRKQEAAPTVQSPITADIPEPTPTPEIPENPIQKARREYDERLQKSREGYAAKMDRLFPLGRNKERATPPPPAAPTAREVLASYEPDGVSVRQLAESHGVSEDEAARILGSSSALAAPAEVPILTPELAEPKKEHHRGFHSWVGDPSPQIVEEYAKRENVSTDEAFRILKEDGLFPSQQISNDTKPTDDKTPIKISGGGKSKADKPIKPDWLAQLGELHIQMTGKPAPSATSGADDLPQAAG